MKKKKAMWKWKIRIYDSFCEYEYELLIVEGTISIHDIYEVVRQKLKAKTQVGRRVSEP